MKKHLLSLSLVALATTQAMAASSYRLEVIDGPVGKYNIQAQSITPDGRIVGAIISRIRYNADSDTYVDNMGFLDSDQLASLSSTMKLKGELVSATDLSMKVAGTSFGFLSAPDITLDKAFGSSANTDISVWSKLMKVSDQNKFGNGSAIWQQTSYQDSDGNSATGYYRQFYVRGFLENAQGTQVAQPVYTLPGVDSGETAGADRIGGESLIADANSQWAVGTSSVALTSSGQSAYDGCNSSTIGVPAILCFRSSGLIGIPGSGKYQDQATYWPISNGSLGAPVALGGLISKQGNELEENIVSSLRAVNSNGIAVGTSVDRNSNGNLLVGAGGQGAVATVFDLNTGKAIKAINDVNSDNFLSSEANDINNSGIVVGARTKQDGSYTLKQFFVYNTQDDSISYPDTFYASANSTANAINDQGLVVGSADWERLPPSSSRRRHAFIYDTSTKTFTDLNNLLEFDSSLVTQDYSGSTCNARADWVLEDAVAINDNGDIAATAVTTLRDSSGAPILDADGNKQYVLRAVKLVPTADTPQSCTAEQDQPYKRKGASFGFWGVLAMAGLGFWRRRHNRV
ncbi:DUF3466 family protein [Gallaecimonas sp. GXIMD1310]|uniref:DUF3466 family protein n=1 Tax=Gallaecimonas sp. GXIMD1310 TaxID=3131926 RepID=UPI003253D9C7